MISVTAILDTGGEQTVCGGGYSKRKKRIVLFLFEASAKQQASHLDGGAYFFSLPELAISETWVLKRIILLAVVEALGLFVSTLWALQERRFWSVYHSANAAVRSLFRALYSSVLLARR
ncbi:hypothetical protein ACLOJK_003554 [Asimina triloba]